MLNNKNTERVISEELIFCTYPEFIKELENKRLNNKKTEKSSFVFDDEKVIKSIMSGSSEYGKLFIEQLPKSERKNSVALIIGEGRKQIIKKEDFQ